MTTETDKTNETTQTPDTAKTFLSGHRRFLLLIPEFLLAASVGILLYTGGMRSGMLILKEPFDSAASLLRSMSLSGEAGNVCAVLLYLLLCLLPLIVPCIRFLMRRRTLMRGRNADSYSADVLQPVPEGTLMRRRNAALGVLLMLLCAYSFYLLYALINPGLLFKLVPKELRSTDMLPVLKCCASSIYYSILSAYLVVRALVSLDFLPKKHSRALTARRLSNLLLGVCILYTAIIGYFGAFTLMADVEAALGAQNPGRNAVCVVIRFLLALLPDICTVLVLLQGRRLAASLAEGMYQNEEQEASRLSRVSRISVLVSVSCSLTCNLLQFLLAGLLSKVTFQIQLPLLSLILSFAALVLSGYFRKAKEEHEDNELFI
ncbi:MAG: hypothetical protein J6B85_09370 [Lachnospiraceae bacterium]|nr:hypothetical protein [Lachnospiraceae bacterium]